ncbi:pentapeptide repeat-containing protein [Arsenophonus apicola]|uniref:E3 ubiquitin-protein ligase SopA n=1 Tax=Arsenophonus apicola TaxID=2879119 RepID=A0ABY8P806_9GAMM|nr:pentapeptide repeat-containing protein [Arsenophonus apicola]WGO84724.1 pentapeptide repeat-containing protein [Arsenophonus apicola]
MQVPPSNGANFLFYTTNTSTEPLSDLDILRQPILNYCSVDERRDLQQRKREILDKLIMQRQVDADLDLSKAELNGLDLSDINLSKANLELANLKNVKFNKATLSGAFLQYADLNHADFSNSYLQQACLCGAILSNANLSEANVDGADFSYANLECAILQGLNLSNVNLAATMLSGADLSDCNLQSKDLTDTCLIKANLNGANLSKVNLTRAIMNEANLSNADFKGADLNGAILTGAILDKAKLSDIAFPVWNIDNLDLYLNHINNNSSLLTTIDSIDEKYHDIKISLVHQLINSLNQRSPDISLSSVVDPLLDILAKTSYNKNPDIINWLSKNILPLYLTKYDINMMPVLDDALVATLLTCMDSKRELMFSHNGAFIQLISQIMAGDSRLKEQTKTLYDCYLQDRRIALYKMMPDFGDYAGRPDWSDKNADNFILLSVLPESDYAMMLSQNQLQQMIDVQGEKADINWYGFYLYQGQENIGPADYQLDTLFQHHFKLFMSTYRFQQQRAKFDKLLATLQLGELQPIFQIAITQRTSQIKLIDFDSQTKLAAIFDNKFTQYTENGVTGYRLTDAYRQQLLQVYNLSNADKATQAKTLLALAAVFSKYSSSAIFGTGTESPNALRYFAFALMEQSHQLAPQTFASEEQYQDWSDRLLGYNNAFSCTAVLSTNMIAHINAQFPTTLAGIMPPAWN